MQCGDYVRVRIGPPAPERGLCSAVKLVEKLPFPTIPYTRPHGADVGYGKHQQQAQPFGVLHDAGEVGDGPGIGDVAFLSVIAHEKVVLHQPGDQIDPLAGQAEALAGGPGRPRAGDLLPACAAPCRRRAAEHGEVERLLIDDQVHDLGWRGDARPPACAAAMAAITPDGAQGVLIPPCRSDTC